MKIWQIVAVSLLCLVLAGSIACSPFGGDKDEVIQQPTEVVRGDLTVSVSGSGNLEVANEVQLAFGTGGKIDELYIEEGDEVGKGEALARLDTDDLELALIQAQLAQTQAEVAQTQAQLAQTQAEVAQTQAEVALELAKFNLDRMEDVQEAKDDIEEAEWEKKIAEMMLKRAVESQSADGDIGYWVGAVAEAQLKILEAQEDLAELLAEDEYASLIVDEVKIKALQVKAAEQSVEQTKQSVEQAKRSVEQAKQSLEQTKKSVELAQKQLDEATIIAPFDGVVASVDADEGDIIPSPTMGPKTIIHLIDTTSMELNAEVDEIDIAEVKPGQRAIIEVDALPTLQLEGKVISISQLPSTQAGVVVYKVRIGLDAPPDSGLKVGMSADADIIISERSNVLLVPDRAIKQDSQGNPIVKVMVDEEIEERPVVIGISDGYQTEIVDGLEEGEVVVVERRGG